MLGPYLRDYKQLLAKFGYQGWYYGHFGEGVVHQRVTFDLESEEGVRAFRRFLEEAADLARQAAAKAEPSLAREIQERVKLYEARRPFRAELIDATPRR